MQSFLQGMSTFEVAQELKRDRVERVQCHHVMQGWQALPLPLVYHKGVQQEGCAWGGNQRRVYRLT